MKVGKKVMAALLAVFLLIGIMPVSAMSAGPMLLGVFPEGGLTALGSAPSGEGLHTIQTVSGSDENGIYTLTLEAFLTGQRTVDEMNGTDIGGPDMELDASAHVLEVITESFEIARDISVYTAACTGMNDDGTFTFAGKTEMIDANVEISPVTPEGGKTFITTVDVTNFDFSANYVGLDEIIDSAGSKTTTPHGKKLIVEIPIKAKGDFFGGNNVPTNSANSGVYRDKDGEPGDCAKTFEVTEANVPIDGWRFPFDTKNVKVYYANDVFLEDVATLWFVNSDNTKTKVSECAEWQKAYVNIEIYFLDDGENYGDFLPAEYIAKNQLWGSVDIDPGYTIISKYNPYEPRNIVKGYDPLFNLELILPIYTVTVTDYETERYTLVDLTDKCVGPLTFVAWTTDNDYHSKFDTLGTEPIIEEYTFDYGNCPSGYEYGHFDGQNFTTNQLDCGITIHSVSIKYAGLDEPLIVSVVPSPESCYGGSNGGLIVEPEIEGRSYDFLIHILTGELVINKSFRDEDDSNQICIFNIKGAEEKTNDIYLTVTVKGNSSVTVKDLPIGKYTVTELDAWSWRYTAENNSYTVDIEDKVTGIVSFTNILSNAKWYADEKEVKNVYYYNKETDPTGDPYGEESGPVSE